MKPTYDELIKLVAQQQQTIACLEKRVAELEERLNLNSNNSSKPPSMDQKKNRRAPRGGAKKGHPGHYRKLFAENKISKRILSSLNACSHCGSTEIKKKRSHILHQIDVPDIQATVTQIECEKGFCKKCGKNLRAPFPKDYAKRSFGPKLITLIGILSSVYRLSKRSTQQLLKMLFNVDISLGSLPNQEKNLSKGLEKAYQQLKEQVDKHPVAYVDETTFRQQAKTHYMWTATTNQAVVVKVLPSRGLESLKQIRPRSHSGVTVTDRYQVYSYKKHQYCLAHIQRDFKKFAEKKSGDQELANRALFELNEIFHACRLHCRKTMQQRVYYRKKRFKEILQDIFANGSEIFSRFAERMLKHVPKLFLFTKYPDVECTNNAAERSLRHLVLWRKTSYGTQSDEGSRFIERAVSIWMTLKKQGKSVVPFFLQAYQATYHPHILSPSI